MAQCDQTNVWTTHRIVCREEVGPSLQGQSASSCEGGYNMETILIVLVVLFLLGGGGWGYSRWRR